MNNRAEYGKGIAPLTNILELGALCQSLIDAPPGLPKIGCFSGFSGYGKTQAAIHAMHMHDALYLEMGASWNATYLCDMILEQLQETVSGRSVAVKVGKIIEALTYDMRSLLIIDEFDHAVRNERVVEIVREISDKSHTPLLIIGEEYLPNKLQKFERFHNRVLNWQLAQPASLEDAQTLHDHHGFVPMTDDLLEKICQISTGQIRRVAVNLQQADAHARQHGLDELSLETAHGLNFFTGAAPIRRRGTYV